MPKEETAHEDQSEATVLLAPSETGQDGKGRSDTVTLTLEQSRRLKMEKQKGAAKSVVLRKRLRTWWGRRRGVRSVPSLMQVSREMRAELARTVPDTPGLEDGEEASLAASSREIDYYWKSVRKGRRQEKYRSRGVYDKGGMGVILDVLDLDLRRKIVMKTLLPKWKNEPEAVAGFVNEARLTGFLEHPHIIPIHELGLSSESGLFFTMKLAEGESLRSVIGKIKSEVPEYVEKYTTFALLGIFRKICDAVSYAHSRRLIHLDIKPHNVLVGKHGEVFLTDWGLARVVGDPAQETDSFNAAFLDEMRGSMEHRDEYVVGTPAYMAPEQAAGKLTALDQRTDVFLLGATLYHLLTLSIPYVGVGLEETLRKAAYRKLEPPATRSPERQIPEELCRIIMKAMSRDQQDRYPTVDDLAHDVDEIMAGRWRPESRLEFAAGELVMKQGDPAREGYVILSGRVGVFRESHTERVMLRECGPGEIIGEMALISNEPRSASVEALDKTTLAVITGEQLAEQLKNLPPYIERMVSTLAKRLRELSAMVHPHLVGDCDDVVARHARLLVTLRTVNQADEDVRIGELESAIAADLGLPNERVRKALESAIESGLIARKGDRIRLVEEE